MASTRFLIVGSVVSGTLMPTTLRGFSSSVVTALSTSNDLWKALSLRTTALSITLLQIGRTVPVTRK